MRWFKRLVVWCTVKRVMPFLVAVMVLDFAIVAPGMLSAEAIWSNHTAVWALVKLHPISWGGADRGSGQINYVLIDGQWERGRLPEDITSSGPAIEFVHFRFRPRRIWTGLIVPCVIWRQRPARMTVPHGPDGLEVPSDTQQQVFRAFTIDAYGDPELARYLPDGGPYQPRLLPAGIIHDALAVPIMLLCIGRFAYRRTVNRYLSRKQWINRVLLCPTCKYNRTGLLDRPCPECGWGGKDAGTGASG